MFFSCRDQFGVFYFFINVPHCGWGLSIPFIRIELMNHFSILCVCFSNTFIVFISDSINFFQSLLMFFSSMDKINGFWMMLRCLNNTAMFRHSEIYSGIQWNGSPIPQYFNILVIFQILLISFKDFQCFLVPESKLWLFDRLWEVFFSGWSVLKY